MALTLSDADRALLVAAQKGDLEKMRAALDAGANVDAQFQKCNALHYAALARNVKLMTLLLARGANVNQPTTLGDTALHLVLEHGSHLGDADAFVHQLLEAGADIDPVNGRSETPLLLAVTHGQVNAVESLLKRGANPNHRDEQGKSAFDRLREANFIGLPAMTRMLMDAAMDTDGRAFLDHEFEIQQVVHQISNDSLEIMKEYLWTPADMRADRVLSSVRFRHLAATGRLPHLTKEEDWQDAPDGLAKLWKAAGPYYQHKYGERHDIEAYLSLAPAERVEALSTVAGRHRLQGLLSVGYLPEIMQEAHWLGAPQDALKLWDAVGSYYQQKHHDVDRSFAYRAANEEQQAGEESKAGWVGRRKSGTPTEAGRNGR